MKKWNINTPDAELSSALARDTGLDPFICRLLVSRGIATRADAEQFFNGDEISDPFTIKDMDKAVETINAAVDNGDLIAIYGDYDCDGITSTYMLYSYLEALGAEVCRYIPQRSEGYGLNLAAVEKLHSDGVQLIITVDNGVSAVEEAERISELGMTLVITDHHQVPDVLPKAAAIVNPHRKDDISPYKNLAGCGVVLKLIMAMEGDIESVMEQFADIAAVGTVADIVRLDGENRIIVRRGLDCLSRTENMGLVQLMKKAGANEAADITSSFLAFAICPRINASGRYQSPLPALELLLCDDMNSAANKAAELCKINDDRRLLEANIFEEAQEQIKADPTLLCKQVLIVQGDDWNPGIIGLISSKLLQKYGKPNIVITRTGSEARGSARSVDGLSLFEMLQACSDKLIRFGGHSKAAGLEVETSRIGEFIAAVDDYCDKHITKPIVYTVSADMEITPPEMTVANVSLIKNLEPFGEGNQAPVFLLRGCTIVSKKSAKDGKFVSFTFMFGGAERRAIYFGSTYDAFGFSEHDTVDILASLEIDEYKGTQRVNVRVEDIRSSGLVEDRYFAARAAYEDYKRGKVDKRLICRMLPDNAEMRRVYDILRGTQVLSKAELAADMAGINCCKFSIILDVFEEFGLIERDVTVDGVKLVPSAPKADLTKSEVLNALKEMEEA